MADRSDKCFPSGKKKKNKKNKRAGLRARWKERKMKDKDTCNPNIIPIKSEQSFKASENHVDYIDLGSPPLADEENRNFTNSIDDRHFKVDSTRFVSFSDDHEADRFTDRYQRFPNDRFIDQRFNERNYFKKVDLHDSARYTRDGSVMSNSNRGAAGVSRDELVPSLLQKIDYLNKQIEILTEENVNLKYTLDNMPLYSDSEVDIVFKRKDLHKKFLPTIKDLVAGLLSGRFSIEELQEFCASFTENKEQTKEPEGDLFSLDISAIPDQDANSSIPKYDSSFFEILEPEDLKKSVDKKQTWKARANNGCFNCSQNHHLSECPYQRDYRKIATAKRRTRPFFAQNVRYHVHGSKELEFKPGVLSEELREALGIKRNQIPLYIYRMRILGYPPGWLTEAAVESSGITVYGSDGNVDLRENNEEGEVEVASIQIQYDPDKLIDYPGFNVLLPLDIEDEANELGFPPIQEGQLRTVVERYMSKPDVRPKRKRELTENRPCKIQCFDEDMEVEEELDGGILDENSEDSSAQFIPPLPQEPLPPPPPDVLPPPPPPPADDDSEPLPPGTEGLLLDENICSPSLQFSLDSGDGASSSENFRIKRDLAESGTASPSLAELEEIKKRLMMELKFAAGETSEDALSEEMLRDSYLDAQLIDAKELKSATGSPFSLTEPFVTLESSNDASIASEGSLRENEKSQQSRTTSRTLERSESGSSKSKFMTLGTPSLSRHSSFTKLPDYELFSKNVTSHLNFENLPNSTGTYQRLKGVLKQVKKKLNSIIH